MATIISYTTIKQSCKLAEILPLESADMFYDRGGLPSLIDKYVTHESIKTDKYQHLIPCWSLAALLGVLPKETRLLKSATDDIYYHCDCPKGNIDKWFDNPVDACVAMIERLHELKML